MREMSFAMAVEGGVKSAVRSGWQGGAGAGSGDRTGRESGNSRIQGQALHKESKIDLYVDLCDGRRGEEGDEDEDEEMRLSGAGGCEDEDEDGVHGGRMKPLASFDVKRPTHGMRIGMRLSPTSSQCPSTEVAAGVKSTQRKSRDKAMCPAPTKSTISHDYKENGGLVPLCPGTTQIRGMKRKPCSPKGVGKKRTRPEVLGNLDANLSMDWRPTASTVERREEESGGMELLLRALDSTQKQLSEPISVAAGTSHVHERRLSPICPKEKLVESRGYNRRPPYKHGMRVQTCSLPEQLLQVQRSALSPGIEEDPAESSDDLGDDGVIAEHSEAEKVEGKSQTIEEDSDDTEDDILDDRYIVRPHQLMKQTIHPSTQEDVRKVDARNGAAVGLSKASEEDDSLEEPHGNTEGSLIHPVLGKVHGIRRALPPKAGSRNHWKQAKDFGESESCKNSFKKVTEAHCKLWKRPNESKQVQPTAQDNVASEDESDKTIDNSLVSPSSAFRGIRNASAVESEVSSHSLETIEVEVQERIGQDVKSFLHGKSSARDRIPREGVIGTYGRGGQNRIIQKPAIPVTGMGENTSKKVEGASTLHLCSLKKRKADDPVSAFHPLKHNKGTNSIVEIRERAFSATFSVESSSVLKGENAEHKGENEPAPLSPMIDIPLELYDARNARHGSVSGSWIQIGGSVRGNSHVLQGHSRSSFSKWKGPEKPLAQRHGKSEEGNILDPKKQCQRTEDVLTLRTRTAKSDVTAPSAQVSEEVTVAHYSGSTSTLSDVVSVIRVQEVADVKSSIGPGFRPQATRDLVPGIPSTEVTQYDGCRNDPGAYGMSGADFQCAPSMSWRVFTGDTTAISGKRRPSCPKVEEGPGRNLPPLPSRFQGSSRLSQPTKPCFKFGERVSYSGPQGTTSLCGSYGVSADAKVKQRRDPRRIQHERLSTKVLNRNIANIVHLSDANRLLNDRAVRGVEDIQKSEQLLAGGANAPKVRQRRGHKKALRDKLNSKRSVSIAGKFKRLAEPSGLLGDFNPGIMQRVRNSGQVQAILEAMVGAAALKAADRASKRVDSFVAPFQVDVGVESIQAVENQAEDPMSASLAQRLHHTVQPSGQVSKEKNLPTAEDCEEKSVMPVVIQEEEVQPCDEDSAHQAKESIIRGDCEDLDLKTTVRGSSDTSDSRNEQPSAHQHINHDKDHEEQQPSPLANCSDSVAAAGLAAQWLELLTLDIKGRLSALKRSRRRVRGVLVSRQLEHAGSKASLDPTSGEGRALEQHQPRVTAESADCSIPDLANLDSQVGRWRALFTNMDGVLCMEAAKLESWLWQIHQMEALCQGPRQTMSGLAPSTGVCGAVPGSSHAKENCPPPRWPLTVEAIEKELAVAASAASIVSTANFVTKAHLFR